MAARKTLIIGLTGYARSGKDTVASMIAEKYNFKMFTFSDLLKTELMKQGRPVTKDEMSKYGDMLRAEYGPEIMAEKMWEKARRFPRVVLSGFRTPEEVKRMRYEADKFFLVFVDAPPRIRFARRKKLDQLGWDDFFYRDKRDIEKKGLDKVVELANFTLRNNGSLRLLEKRVEELMEKILG